MAGKTIFSKVQLQLLCYSSHQRMGVEHEKHKLLWVVSHTADEAPFLLHFSMKHDYFVPCPVLTFPYLSYLAFSWAAERHHGPCPGSPAHPLLPCFSFWGLHLPVELAEALALRLLLQ